jgi:hypothetical protein
VRRFPAVEYAACGVEATASLIFNWVVSIGGEEVDPLTPCQGGMKPWKERKKTCRTVRDIVSRFYIFDLKY